MRLAIVSDIHGNLTALDAVVADIERRGVDRVIHGGDLALAGSQPAEVIDRVRELGWDGIVGNTDELLWRPQERVVQERNAPKLRNLLRVLFEEYAPGTRARPTCSSMQTGWHSSASSTTSSMRRPCCCAPAIRTRSGSPRRAAAVSSSPWGRPEPSGGGRCASARPPVDNPNFRGAAR